MISMWGNAYINQLNLVMSQCICISKQWIIHKSRYNLFLKTQTPGLKQSSCLSPQSSWDYRCRSLSRYIHFFICQLNNKLKKKVTWVLYNFCEMEGQRIHWKNFTEVKEHVLQRPCDTSGLLEQSPRWNCTDLYSFWRCYPFFW